MSSFRLRYAEVDLALASVMRSCPPAQRQVHTYDVMCMYKLNFRDRLVDGGLVTPAQIPPLLVQKVPAWHIGAHIASCQDDHHLRYTPLVGRTHGEGVEPIWSKTNGFQYATREMSFGHRIDNLTDVFNDHNHDKVGNEGE